MLETEISILPVLPRFRVNVVEGGTRDIESVVDEIRIHEEYLSVIEVVNQDGSDYDKELVTALLKRLYKEFITLSIVVIGFGQFIEDSKCIEYVDRYSMEWDSGTTLRLGMRYNKLLKNETKVLSRFKALSPDIGSTLDFKPICTMRINEVPTQADASTSMYAIKREEEESVSYQLIAVFLPNCYTDQRIETQSLDILGSTYLIFTKDSTISFLLDVSVSEYCGNKVYKIDHYPSKLIYYVVDLESLKSCYSFCKNNATLDISILPEVQKIFIK